MKLIDLVLIIIIAAFLVLAVRYIIKSKKKGKPISGCSGDCSHCIYHDKDCTLSL